MGEQIVVALEAGKRRPGEPDLLSRWIAQEVARAIAAAERSRTEAARREAITHASDLILKLWEHRSDWPDGWPPEDARRRAEQFTQSRATDAEPGKSGSPWLDRLRELEDIWLEEGLLWWRLGLLETGVETSRNLVEALPEDRRSGPDIDLIRREVKLRDLGEAWLRERGADTKQKARELIEETLEEHARRRHELLNGALAKMKSPRSYPGPPRPKDQSTTLSPSSNRR